MYTQDYNDYFPPAFGPGYPSANCFFSCIFGSSAPWNLYASVKIMRCPSDRTNVIKTDWWEYPQYKAARGISYGYNAKVGGNWHPGPGEDRMPGIPWDVRMRGHKVSWFKDPSNSILVVETDNGSQSPPISGSGAPYYPFIWYRDYWYVSGADAIRLYPHHTAGKGGVTGPFGGGNYLFVDGSVRYYSIDEYLHSLRKKGDTVAGRNDTGGSCPCGCGLTGLNRDKVNY
jgi:prepilin-type processing-associated H-X9-DG protein